LDGWLYIQTRVVGKRRQINLANGRANESAAYARWRELGTSKPDIVARLRGGFPCFSVRSSSKSTS